MLTVVHSKRWRGQSSAEKYSPNEITKPLSRIKQSLYENLRVESAPLVFGILKDVLALSRKAPSVLISLILIQFFRSFQMRGEKSSRVQKPVQLPQFNPQDYHDLDD